MKFWWNSKRKPVRVQKAMAQIPAARGFKGAKVIVPAAARHPVSRDFHRGMIMLASLATLLGGVLAGGYGVHSQIASANERAARQYWRIVEATREELRNGTILFVPIGGNVCRRRWIDNATWTLRDGEEVECDSAVRWNATVPEQQYQVGIRLDAVRNTFRNRAAGNLE